MGNYSEVPIFGVSFQRVFPILLLVLVLLNVTDLYTRVLSMLGLKKWLFDEDIGEQLQTQGEKIILKQKIKEQWKINNLDFKKVNMEIEEIYSPHKIMDIITEKTDRSSSSPKFGSSKRFSFEP